MAIKDLLVVLDPNEKQGPAHAFAQALASRMGAHLTAAGLAVQFIAPVSFAGDYPYDLLAQVTEQSRQTAESAYDKLRSSVPAGVETQLVMIEAVAGLAQSRLAELARHFDLTIMSQEDDGSTGDESGMIVATLMGSGRPVFVIPYIFKGEPRLDHALVAWDGSKQATRSVAAAMPLLEMAKRVEVVSVAAKGTPAEELPGFNLTRHLARHGVKAELRQLAPASDVGATILSYASDTGADYLVMGGYGHSRFRELILGGATRNILSSMTIPIFMTH